MKREFTCIICPNGCEIVVNMECTDNQDAIITAIDGAECPRGKQYVEQEIKDPQRNIATLILVNNGELPVASVRLTNPIPKKDIFNAMEKIKKCSLNAPVAEGYVVIKNLLGYDTDVIVTKPVKRC